MSVNIITYTGKTRTAQHDGMTYDAAIGQSGIFYGCEITAVGNALTVGGGFGIIKGRVFQIEEETITVPLASSGTQGKMLVLTLDLSNSETPLALSVQASNYSLTMDTDANFTLGIYQLKLATFSVTSVEITNIATTYDIIHGGIVNVTRTNESLNDYRAQGIYYFDGNHTPTDVPGGSVNGWLIVLSNGFSLSVNKQIWIRQGSEATQSDTYVRAYTSGAWTTWQRLVTESEMYYMPGTQARLFMAGGGFLTNAKTEVRTLIPLCKPMHSSVNTITLVSSASDTITIRQNGNYLADDVRASTLSPTFTKAANGIYLNLSKTSGFGGTNNDSVAILGNVTVRFS